jgi:hydrogenase expression/formation protein HypE
MKQRKRSFDRKSRYGKLAPSLLKRVVYRNLGLGRESILVGPGNGFDNAIIRVDESRLMVVTTDPISVIPGLGMKDSAWLSVHLIASDYTTSACAPEYASFDYNFPEQMDVTDKEAYLVEMGHECGRLGISIVAGHTGTYPGAGFTVIGGGTMMGFTSEASFVDPSMSECGDAILMTKGAAIEATAVLANSFPGFVEERIGRRLTARAKKYTRLCSTVNDSLTASSVGIRKEGVTSMHDATEGGVLGALDEMASASEHTFVVREQDIEVSNVSRGVCSVFGIDPLLSVSEGTLLLTCKKDRAEEVARRLRRGGVQACDIGEVTEGSGGLLLERIGKKARRFTPRPDPFWAAYERWMMSRSSVTSSPHKHE